MPIIDYGAKAKRLERGLFESGKIAKRNKNLLQRFLISYDVSAARLSIFLERIRFLLEASDDVEALLKDRDQLNIIFREFRNKYSPATCNTFANVAIRFGRWLNDGELPVGLKDISKLRAAKEKRDLDPSDMITWDEGIALSEKTTSIQVKAILLTQLDAGFRPSEFVDLNYGDVSVQERVVVFHVRGGKTGSRDVVAYRSAPHFLKWYYSHPTKRPEDPLWLREYFHPSRANEYVAERYAYPAIRKRIRSLGFRCDFKKPLDFYNLRHSSCTLDKIDNLPVELACDRHGHSVKYYTGVYGRLSTKDVVNRFKSHYGEKIETSRRKENAICEFCEYPNPHDAKACLRCNGLLSTSDRAFGATGKFKEILEKESEIERRSVDLENQENRMLELDTRIKMMEESLRDRNAEIDSKIALVQNWAKEIALKEIRLKTGVGL